MTEHFQRQCLSDQIRKTLMNQIISGQLKPGERLVELKLAKEFQTSQTPVREALQKLVSMRMLEALPHRGVRVREVSETEMAEAYSVRGLLEEFAAPMAAIHLAGDVDQLSTLASKIQKAANKGNAKAYAEHDFLFHRGIVAASENTTLLRLWDSLAFEFRTPLMMSRHRPDLPAAAEEHFQVVKALEDGKGKLAGKLLRQHSDSIIRTATLKDSQ